MDGFFKILDKNSDGRLSFEEFLGEETHIDKIFRTMDKDNDGFVSKEVEFNSHIDILSLFFPSLIFFQYNSIDNSHDIRGIYRNTETHITLC